jgi:hypothetical protein
MRTRSSPISSKRTRLSGVDQSLEPKREANARPVIGSRSIIVRIRRIIVRIIVIRAVIDGWSVVSTVAIAAMAVSIAVVRFSAPWVRIPPSPPISRCSACSGSRLLQIRCKPFHFRLGSHNVRCQVVKVVRTSMLKPINKLFVGMRRPAVHTHFDFGECDRPAA